MKIKVRTIGCSVLAWHNADGEAEGIFEIPYGSTVEDLFTELKVPEDEPLMATIGGKAVMLEEILVDGADVVIMPLPIGA